MPKATTENRTFKFFVTPDLIPFLSDTLGAPLSDLERKQQYQTLREAKKLCPRRVS